MTKIRNSFAHFIIYFSSFYLYEYLKMFVSMFFLIPSCHNQKQTTKKPVKIRNNSSVIMLSLSRLLRVTFFEIDLKERKKGIFSMESSFVTEKSIESSIQKLCNLVDSAKKSLEKLRQENKILESARSLSIIHLAQYKNDYESLQRLYHKFKELSTSNYPVIYQQQNVDYSSQSQIQRPPAMPMQQYNMIQQVPMVPAPSVAQIEQIPISFSPQRPIKATPKVDVLNEEVTRNIDIIVPSPPSPAIAAPPPPTSSATRRIDENEEEASEPEQGTLTVETPSFNVKATDPFYQNGQHVRLLYALSTDAVVCTVNFSHDGSMVVFANTKTAFVVNSNDGSVISRINMLYSSSVNEFNPRCIRFTPDNKRIVLGNDDNDAVVFDVQTGAHVATLKKHVKKISSIIFTHQGKTLVTAGYDKNICLWNMEDFTLIKKIEHTKDIAVDDMIVSIAHDNEQSFITVGFMNGSVGVYDIDFEQPMLLFKAHDANIMNIAISPFDDSIATGSDDMTTKIWGLHGRLTHRTTLADHKDLVLALAFKPDGPMLFTGSKDETIRAWDYKKSQLLFEIDPHKNTVFEISHHPSLNRFVSCSGEGLVCMWEYDTQ